MYNSSDIILYVIALIRRIATSSSSSRLESEIFLKCCVLYCIVLYFGFVLKSDRR
jgi:hypothetical protein